jgi:hypothetical protein
VAELTTRTRRSVSFFPYHDTKSNLHYLAIYGSIDIAEAKYSALVSSVDHTTGTIEVERTSSAETVDFALKAASHYIRDPIENDFAGLAWIGIFYEREEITRFSLSLGEFSDSVCAYYYLMRFCDISEEKRMRLDRDAYEIKLREIELDQPRQDIAYRGLLFEGKVLLTMFTRVPFR